MIETVEQNEGHRINHPAFKDVYNVTYAKGVITEFEVEDTPESMRHEYGAPALSLKTITTPFVAWEFTDRVKLDISEDEWVPIFYHCKLHCYDEEVVSLRDNKALKGSAYAFQVGDEVNVLLEEGVPKYVIGPADNKARMCAQYLKLSFDGNPYYSYSNPIVKEEAFNEEPKDYYGNVPNCDQPGSIVTIVSEKVRGDDPEGLEWARHGIDFYFLIYSVKVGPVLYILWMRAAGDVLDPSAGVCGDMRVFSGVWTKELEAQCKGLSSVSSWQLQDHAYIDWYKDGLTAGFSLCTFTTWPELVIYSLHNPYPSAMKEQKFFSYYAESVPGGGWRPIKSLPPAFGIFWPAREERRKLNLPSRLLDFYNVKVEGQSYYEKEEEEEE